MAPALPALAVLAVRRFDGATLWGRLSLWATAATGLPVLVFAAVVGFWFRVGPWWAWLAASATIAGAAYAWALRRDLVAGSALAGVWFMLVGGILYPCLDINRLPDALTPEVVGSRPVYLFNSSRPAYLATRLDRPVLAIHARLPGNGVPQEIAEEKMTDALDVLPRAVRENAVIAVIGEQERRFLFLLNVIGVAPRTTLMAWRSLGTRGTFLQIARKGATFDDWRQAWELRDLSVLGETCRLYADFAPLAGGSIER
jgi:hypothetical protein